jgi:hypothetical protein
VEPLELSGGNLTKNNGKVAWRINLKPFETTELLLKYEVKYPKDQILEIN